MRGILLSVDFLLGSYIFVLLAVAIVSLLIGFRAVKEDNRVMVAIGKVLGPLTEPALRPVRRLAPNLGGVDFAPVVVILLIVAARYVIAIYLLPRVA
jgi:YggT family protein